MEMLRTIFLLVCCYAFCALPKVIRLVITHQHLFEDDVDHQRSPYDVLLFIPYLLLFALNVVIYAFTNKQYFEVYKSYLNYLSSKFGFSLSASNQSVELMTIRPPER